MRAALLLLAVPVLALAGEGRIRAPGPFCPGDYGDVLTSLRQEVRTFESSSKGRYVYLLRSTATYEHISYGRGGTIRHQYLRHTRHGTGFAYRSVDGEWLVATNEHVARHPEIVQAENPVEGVPLGSRKVREVLRIVKDESSDDDHQQIPLTLVGADEELDVAVLASRVPLQIMPYRLGHSSALLVGNVVLVRGYPLGMFATSNTGRVIGVGHRDRERGWNHEDFVVDALLNPGNSGSPVFALSCRSGELELVGIYHAGYREAQGLNVVVSVDQLRDLLENPRAPKQRPVVEEKMPDRAALREMLAMIGPVVMPFGDRGAEARAGGDAVIFSIFEGDWPLGARIHLLVKSGGEAPTSVATAGLGRITSVDSLDSELRETAVKLEDALWRQLLAVLRYRAAESLSRPEARELMAVIAAHLRGRIDDQRDTLQAFDYVSEKAIATTGASGTNGAAPAAGTGDNRAQADFTQ